MHRLFVILAASVALFASQGARAAFPLRIATEGTYRPWNFIDANGQLAGFDIDVAHDLCRRMRARCTITAQDWNGMIPSLQTGKFDAVIACMSITPARRRAIQFSTPYAFDYYTFLARRDAKLRFPAMGRRIDIARQPAAITGLRTALAGKRVGVVSADSTAPFFVRHLDPQHTRLLRYGSAELMQLDLLAGRIDATLTSLGRVNEVLRRPEMARFAATGPVLYGDMLGEGIGVGLAQGRPALRARVDRAIGEAIRDGTIRRLSIKWMGVDLTPAASPA